MNLSSAVPFFTRAALSCALATLSLGNAHAEQAPQASKSAGSRDVSRISLAIPDCPTPAFDPRTLVDLLRVELAFDPFELSFEARDDDSSEVHVALSPSSCDRDVQQVSIDITHADTPLVVSLGEVAQAARARTLALVIAEALRGHGAANAGREPEIATPRPALVHASERGQRLDADEPADGIDALYATSDPYSSAPVIDVGALLQARSLPQDAGMLLGAGLDAHVQLWHSFRAALELSYATGRRSQFDGVQVDWWSAATGIDIALTQVPAFRLGWRAALARVLLLSAGDQRVLDTLVASAGVRVGLGLPVGDRASLECFAEGMHTLNGLAAPWDPAFDSAGVRGWVVSWGLGLALQP